MLKKGKALRIQLWGVRGSLPSPRTPVQEFERLSDILYSAIKSKVKTPKQVKSFLKSLPDWQVHGYGGNTSCVEINSQKSNIIIDGGSGIRELAEHVMKKRTQKEFHIVMSHFHWDHLIGLPFFTPFFLPGYTVHFYAVQPELEKMIRRVFERPTFPVPFEELKAKIHFHALEERTPYSFGDIKLTPFRLDHPDPCYGFRIESGGKVYSHVVDTECTRTSRTDLGPDLPLYQDVDLMLFDAQYTLKEATEKVHWGHSSAIIGLELALRETIRHMLFVHHDPASTDETIFFAQTEAAKAFETSKRLAKLDGQKIPKIKWEFAREGLVIEL